MRILYRAIMTATTAYGPQPRTLQCAACGFWYQEGSGHACVPC